MVNRWAARRQHVYVYAQRNPDSGASLREVASRLGATSRNAYARYERGEVVPTVDKLHALLKAASPGGDFVIRESTR